MKYNNKKLRHELKFIINHFEYKILRERLKYVLQKDAHSDKNGEYTIRSLYFDDIYNSSLFEKQSGVECRHKFRIRIYDLNDRVIKLEKKTKLGQYTCKEAALIGRDEAHRIISGDFIFMKYSPDALLRSFYLEAAANLLSAAVIVEYDREAYCHPSGNIRVTFDKNLRSGLGSTDIFDKNIPIVSTFKDPVMIMEIKYDNFFPAFLTDMLRISMRQRISVSKYTLCRMIYE